MKKISLSNSLNFFNIVRMFAILIGWVFISGAVLSQEKVTGKVTDALTGEPLPGVSIVIKGTATGAISNMGGNFEIMVPTLNTTLVFSFVGYLTEEVQLEGKSHVIINMTRDEAVLEESVVIGYGRKNRLRDYVQSKIIVADSEASYQQPAVFYNPSIETYSLINETGFSHTMSNPLSTFSISVDRASYSNVRRFINNGQMPPADAVRIEEMINYFNYEYPQPADGHPFSVSVEYSDSPWEKEHKLMHIGLQGKDIPMDELPPSNLVFLIDVSGSMASANRMPLVKAGFKLLVSKLRSIDNVSIVVYASQVGVVLPSTPGDEKDKIIEAIDGLVARGSTAGGAGIQKAYEVAVENFIPGGNNRVILATDGDFNVGISNENDLERFIEKKRETGVFLTCLGFGMGNYKDSKMETLSRAGNGNYAYIDNIQEANKVFIQEFGGTLFTIAKDVKLQIDFNPAKVQGYRLIGYENRRLNMEDFKDDTKDAGEIGSGHSVTAIYEIIPADVESRFLPQVMPSKYQNYQIPESIENKNEIATVRLRYKQPDEDTSIEFKKPVGDKLIPISKTSENFRFSTSVAMFGMLLQNSEFIGNSNYGQVIKLAENARGTDEDGYRAEYIRLVKTIKKLDNNASK